MARSQPRCIDGMPSLGRSVKRDAKETWYDQSLAHRKFVRGRLDPRNIVESESFHETWPEDNVGRAARGPFSAGDLGNPIEVA